MDVKYIKSLLNCFAEVMQENREFLIEQDSIVGDGDLGLTMSDGFQAAAEAVRKSDETDAGKLLYGRKSDVCCRTLHNGYPDGKWIYAGGESVKGCL